MSYEQMYHMKQYYLISRIKVISYSIANHYGWRSKICFRMPSSLQEKLNGGWEKGIRKGKKNQI